VAAPGAEVLDDAERAVPPPGIRSGAVVPQLIEDLVHLERSRDGLDENRRPDRAARNAERALREVEGVVPQPRLQVALQLGQVEVGALALVELALRAVEEVQREVEQAAGYPLAVHQYVLLVQMPAARPHDDGRELLVGQQPVGLALLAGVVDLPVQCVLQVELAGDHVVPQRGVRILVVGEPHLRARVEGVDRHFPVGWPGDLPPPVHQARRRLGHAPGAILPDRPGLLEEVEGAAGRKLLLAARTRGQQLRAPRAQLALQCSDQAEGRRGEDLLISLSGRAGYLHALSLVHALCSSRAAAARLLPVLADDLDASGSGHILATPDVIEMRMAASRGTIIRRPPRGGRPRSETAAAPKAVLDGE